MQTTDVPMTAPSPGRRSRPMPEEQTNLYAGTDPNIRRALTSLSSADRQKFRKAFRDQADDKPQLLHTSRALFAGVFMVRQGYGAEYERSLGGQTPDWYFTGRDGRPDFFAEVVNFHLTLEIEANINWACERTGGWCGWLPNNEHRLYPSIQGKAAKYKALAAETGLPFVVFVYGLFDAFVQLREVEACLLPAADGLFRLYPTLTGAYYFDT